MVHMHSWRSATVLRALLISALAAGTFVGSYELVAGSAGPQRTLIQSQPETSAAAQAQLEPFSSAEAGSCVTWDIGPVAASGAASGAGSESAVTNFRRVDCAEPHRFEVSVREDLAVYPTSEFGPQAPVPSQERQAQLREELCYSATVDYLHGQWDPYGKFSLATILPPASAWDAGDRTLLCGLQTTDESGMALETVGPVSGVDQANIAEPGTCRTVGDNQVLRSVPCQEPHQLEVISVVNLSEHFGEEHHPDLGEQNAFLADRCAQQAEAYLGSEENLYQSTLKPYWGTISAASWNGGTRSVNCSLIHTDEHSPHFSTLEGSAADFAQRGRDALRINGELPVEPPARNPLREAPAPEGTTDG